MSVIESKVIAAAAGSGAGAAAAGFLLWLLGVVAFGAPSSAGHAADAVAAVPEPVALLIGVVVTIVSTAVAGYLAPHTTRPGPAPDNTAPDGQIASPQLATVAAMPDAPAVLVATQSPAPPANPGGVG